MTQIVATKEVVVTPFGEFDWDSLPEAVRGDYLSRRRRADGWHDNRFKAANEEWSAIVNWAESNWRRK
jgi:hypothetical protein